MPTMTIDQLRKAAELADQLNQHVSETYQGTPSSDWIRKRAEELHLAIDGDLRRLESQKRRQFKHQHKTS